MREMEAAERAREAVIEEKRLENMAEMARRRKAVEERIAANAEMAKEVIHDLCNA
jgi:hypothetical protein